MQEAVKIKTAFHGPDSPSILIIYTGGTFGMAYDNKGRLLHPFDFASILEQLPELNRFEMELTFISIDQPTDSSNFNELHWVEMAEIIFNHYNFYDGFVILHGTDTMAYSASALSFLLENLDKPVIFTGAQLPIGVARTDARENFITSLEMASAHENGKPLIQEVCIYFNDTLIRGNRAKKTQSIHFDAFVSENYPILAKAGVSIEYNKVAFLNSNSTQSVQLVKELNINIANIKLFPGINEKSLKAILEIENLEVIILETYGSGNAPDASWLIDLLKTAIDNGIIIYNVSQCMGGKVIQGKYQTSRQLKAIGVVSGGNITFEAAIAKSMYVLSVEKERAFRIKMLSTSLRGEMDSEQ